MGVRYVMTASPEMPGSLNQLHHAELTATCRLAVSPYLWRSSRVAPIRCSARISDLSPGHFVDRQTLAGRSLRAGKTGNGFQRP
jgi:hypothetical protein